MARRSLPSFVQTAPGAGTDHAAGGSSITEERALGVLRWAANCGRDLPWRLTRDPWSILVSEVMAQQTQVDRVIPKWFAFLERWPTPEQCAEAPLGEILRVWSGLGYPRRARNLHEAAKQIAVHGSFPDTLDGLRALPGVGEYTARAVLAFAFERDVAVVDTNTARVLARWHNRRLSRREVQDAADSALPIGDGWAWNQALLDLGALVCTRRSPRCEECPVISLCTYGQQRLLGTEGDDPADGTAGVSVAQSRFAGSDRQYRGRLLKAAAASRLDRLRAPVEIGLDGQPERVAGLIEDLIREGLLVETAGRLHLP
jgi:A/G-specific adenine glycosylase